ncbi:MAG: hypothetical protein IE878_05630 [Epsilonproteobacteria bacterium]|nr:hypothetical protein [Campylobacterota bacterium]
MMESTKNIVDYYLFFVAPTIKSGKSLKHTINLEILHEQKIGQDLLIWSKKIKAN